MQTYSPNDERISANVREQRLEVFSIVDKCIRWKWLRTRTQVRLALWLQQVVASVRPKWGTNAEQIRFSHAYTHTLWRMLWLYEVIIIVQRLERKKCMTLCVRSKQNQYWTESCNDYVTSKRYAGTMKNFKYVYVRLILVLVLWYMYNLQVNEWR